MINFDVYRNNPTAAANLIAREGKCEYCLMNIECSAAPNHDYDKCYKMWSGVLESGGGRETLGSVDDFSALLSSLIDCNKCTVGKLNKCDCIDRHHCVLTICNWMCDRFTFCPEPR